ncbi:hypothetical protein LCGC14_2397700, partial [marine sediment metagenome]
MGKMHGRHTRIYLNGYDLSGDINSFEPGYAADTAEVSGFGDDTKKYVVGLADPALRIQGLFNDGSAQIHAVAESLVGNEVMLNATWGTDQGKFGVGGTVSLNDSVMQGTASGNIMLFASNSGTITATNCDFVNASGSNQGVFKSTGILNLVSCFIAGTFGFDISIVDISTATTDKQHSGVDTITTPRSTRNEIPDYS